MPASQWHKLVLRPLRGLIIRSFDQENLRTMAAVKTYAEAQRV
jgi:hypothetical protein